MFGAGRAMLPRRLHRHGLWLREHAIGAVQRWQRVHARGQLHGRGRVRRNAQDVRRRLSLRTWNRHVPLHGPDVRDDVPSSRGVLPGHHGGVVRYVRHAALSQRRHRL